jgi:hypothetical protein
MLSRNIIHYSSFVIGYHIHLSKHEYAFAKLNPLQTAQDKNSRIILVCLITVRWGIGQTPMRSFHSSVDLILQPHYSPGDGLAYDGNLYQKCLWVCKADFTAICEPIV